MIEIKEKHLDRREWYNDEQRDFDSLYHKDEFFEGGIGLITFTGIEEPDMVDTIYGKLAIADKGYQWLELAPKDGHYTLTAMFDADRLFQHYVDITLKNEVKPDGDAVFYDLILDVVVSEDGEPHLIDCEELEEAFATGVIDKDTYELAKKSADEVISFYRTNKKKLEDKLFEYRNLFS